MSRLKQIMILLAIGLVLLIAALLLFNVAYGWWTGRQLEQRLTRLRAAGEPTSFAELAPRPIGSRQDAAVHLQRLTPQLDAFAKEHVEFLDRTPLGKAFREQQDRGEAPTPEQIAAIREILSHYPDLTQALDKASHCQGYASRIDFSVPESQMMNELIASANGLRTPIRFLRLKITLLLAEGEQEEALRTGLIILRLARLYDNEPSLVNGLVAIAVRSMATESLNLVLRAGSISKELHKELDQELALHDDSQRLVEVMKTERAINISAAKSLFAQSWWLPWLERGLVVDMIDFHERLLPAISQPWHASHLQIDRLNTDISNSTYISGTLVALCLPAIQAGNDAFHRNMATLRCLRIVNALTAHAPADGQEAEGLDDLDLPDKSKIDPFSGEPLKLKWTDNGWVVYSVFKNGTDDGGQFKDMADWGLGPAGYPGIK